MTTAAPDLAIGGVTVHRVIDIDPFALPLRTILPDATPQALEPHRALLAGHVDLDAETVLLAVQTHVVRAGGLTILVDTCVGEHKQRPRRAEWHERAASGYIERLAAAGVSPQDVDIVLCSHLHVDHVGWNTVLADGRWVPTFPRARYVMARGELEHWQAEVARDPSLNHGCYADSVLPVIEAGLAAPITAGDAISEHATTVPMAGHTPGHIGLDVATGTGRSMLFCGDAIHSPAQILEPSWSSGFCSDRAQAARTRLSILERVCEDATVLVPNHVRGPGFNVRRQGLRFIPTLCGCDGHSP